MSEMPTEAAGHIIEPELFAAAPRSVRKRSGQTPFVFLAAVASSLAVMLWVSVKVAWIELPIRLTASNGQVIPAHVAYRAGASTSAFRGEVYRDAILAQFTYVWRGVHYRDVREVDASLMQAFPNHSIVPVKVLSDFPALEWPGSNEEPRWQRREHLFWPPVRQFFLIFAGLTGLLVMLEFWTDRVDRRLASEGKAITGSIVEYRTKNGRMITGKFPKHELIRVVFEFPVPAGWRDEGMHRARRQCFAKQAALLPPAGQPVTVLLLPARRWLMSCPYLICRYEAFTP